MSATHNRSGASGRKFRSARSRARSAAGSAIVVRLTTPRRAPTRPISAINLSTVHRATRIDSRFSCNHTFRAPYTSKFSL